MARAKKQTEPELQTVRVLVGFNGMYAGDTAQVVVDSTVQGWINAGLVKIDATDKAGPGTVEPADPGSVQVGTGRSSESGGEPSQGFGAGGYGAFEGVDQD